MGGFKEFIYQSVVPACILAPLKPSFDLNDAQTVIVSDIALCKDLNRLKLLTIIWYNLAVNLLIIRICNLWPSFVDNDS